jgi:hypothetical protein
MDNLTSSGQTNIGEVGGNKVGLRDRPLDLSILLISFIFIYKPIMRLICLDLCIVLRLLRKGDLL